MTASADSVRLRRLAHDIPADLDRVAPPRLAERTEALLAADRVVAARELRGLVAETPAIVAARMPGAVDANGACARLHLA